MNFSDIFKNSFLETINTGDIDIKSVVILLGIACLFAAYIFFIYRVLTRKSFYSKEFNISLAVIIVIVAAIVITIQSSLVVSLGMVGALSIVRFRTAIKSAMDLVFLFWAISIGIIVGAGLPGIALITTIVITIGIFVLDMIPVARPSEILLVNCKDRETIDEVTFIIKKYTKTYSVKSQVIDDNKVEVIYELRIKDVGNMLDSISSLKGIKRVSLLNHNGEATF